MFISIILDVILTRNENNFPLTREIIGTHPIKAVENDENNIDPQYLSLSLSLFFLVKTHNYINKCV